jgi:hypothetical protein
MLRLEQIRTDGGTQPRAQIDWVVVSEYAADMEEGATFPPVVVFYDGSDYWLADGFHRVEAAKSLGLVEIAADIRQGTRRDAVLYSVGANTSHGLRRTNEDKRRAVLTLLNDEEWRGWSDNRIAQLCGVSQPFVSSMRSSLITVISDPRTYTDRWGNVSTMNTANIGQRPTPMPSGIAEATDTLERDTLLDWYFPDPEERARMEDIIAEEEGEDDDASRQYDGESPAWCKYCYTTHDKWSIASDCIVPGWECGLCGHVTADEWIEVYSPEPPAPEPEPAAPETKPHVAYNAGNNEWYTPPEYIAAAIEVMGGIDLDPATTPKANEVVGATRIYTADDDGLFYPWQGRVWMNPPYASELVGKFASKLAQHAQTGDVTDAIVLVNNATETGWFYTLTSVASAVVFPKGRVRFWEPNGAISAPLQGQAVVYIGPRPDLFLNAYRQFGWGATLWQHN